MLFETGRGFPRPVFVFLLGAIGRGVRRHCGDFRGDYPREGIRRSRRKARTVGVHKRPASPFWIILKNAVGLAISRFLGDNPTFHRQFISPKWCRKNRRCGPAARRMMRWNGSAISSVMQRRRWAATAVFGIFEIVLNCRRHKASSIKARQANLTIHEPDRARVFLYAGKGRAGKGIPLSSYRSYRNPHGSWATAVDRAGLGDLHLHDLRHTFASRLIMRGVPILAVSKLLGHASLTMTMRYAHLAPDGLDAAIAAIDGGRSFRL